MKKVLGFVYIVLLMCCCLPHLPVYGEKPILTATINGKEQPLEMSKLDIHIDITGMVAETRMTMTFFNPNSIELEGKLHFPLPQGAFVSGYALDVNGQMVDGVVVEKEKGRAVFDDIVQRKVDPGLVEWVKGNKFQTSVYPIFPKKSRTIMVRFVSRLKPGENGFMYHLPLKYNLTVKQFSLLAKIGKPRSQKDKGKSKGKKNSLSNFKMDSWKDIRTVKTEKKNFLLDENLDIPVPVKQDQGEKNMVSVEQNPDGQYYFSIHDWEAAKRFNAPIKKITPKRVTIFWDNSGSREKVDHKKELSILRAYFSRLKNNTVRVKLVAFSSIRQDAGNFIIRNGNCDSLIRAIENFKYDGGTTMGVISPRDNEKSPDLYLLFTDGDHNFGLELPKGFKAPLFVIGSGDARHAYLNGLAAGTGGRYFDTGKTGASHIAGEIGISPLTFISAAVEDNGANGLFPSRVTVLPEPGQPFILTGKLKGKKAVVTLNYGQCGKILHRQTVNVFRKDAVNSNVLRTLWAQEKINHLVTSPRDNKKKLVEHGKAYGLVTPGTSLIVLEFLDDYIRYRIKPPKCLPEMRQQYELKVENAASKDSKTRKERIEKILVKWKRRVEWWNKFDTKKKAAAPKVEAVKQPPRQDTEDNEDNDDAEDAERTGEEESREEESREETQPRQTVTRGGSFQTVDLRKGQGQIQGAAVDPEGTVLPGITVTLIDTEKGTSFVLITSETGKFRFTGLPFGKYSVKFELLGFNTVQRKNITIRGAQRVRLGDVAMQFSSIKEEIVITGTYNVDGVDTTGADAAIQLKPWDPKTPYMKKIKKASHKKAYNVYLEQKKEYGASPGFYSDCADYFFRIGQEENGLRILSNIAELNITDGNILRIPAHRLEQLGYLELSAELFRQIVEDQAGQAQFQSESQPQFQPQSYRDLALVLARLQKYPEAIQLLYKVVLYGGEDERQPDIDIIALTELNRILPGARKKYPGNKDFGIDSRLIKLLDYGLRVILTWDSDSADMDLWVTEPGGDKVYYENDKSEDGGYIADDATEGLGPEEYTIRFPVPGQYLIQADYYGGGNRDAGPVTLQAVIFTNYGRKNQERKAITVRLDKEKEVITIGKINFGK